MFSWVQLVKFLVIIGALAAVLYWVHRTSVKQTDARKGKKRGSHA